VGTWAPQMNRRAAMERRATRSWEPGDFFELSNIDAPDEAIEHGCHCLLYGPEGCGKTTLLFQHALAAGATLAHFRAQLEALRNTSLTLELNLSTFGTHPRINLGHVGHNVSLS